MKINSKTYLLLTPCLFLLLVFPLVTQDPIYMDMFIMFCLMAGVGSAWNIIGGYGGQFSIGHAGFFGIGAYTSTLLYLNFNLSPWIGMLIGGLLAALISFLVFYPCFRLRGIFFTMASLAFCEILMIISIYWQSLTGGNVGLLILYKPGFADMMFEDKIWYAYIALLYMLLGYIIAVSVEKSKLGSHLTAVREDEDAAESLGVSSTRYKLYAMMISAFFSAMGGTLFAQYTQFIDPDTVFEVALSVRFALFAIIGGIATSIGPIIGSLIMTPMDTMLRGALGGSYAGLGFLIYGIFLILFVLLLPEGVMKWVRGRLFPAVEKLPPISLFARKKQPVAVSLLSPKTSRREGNEGEPLIKIVDVTKSFGGLKALNEVSFNIAKGEIVGLIGPNGAGKTTLFNVIDGYYKPDSGSILFEHQNITALSPPHKICACGIGRTFQIVKPFANISVFENVMVGSWQMSSSAGLVRARTMEILKFVGLEQYSQYQGSSLTISNRKRLELARALATGPKLLLLDEVMAGLNPTETEAIIDLIKQISAEMKVTLLIIEHNMKAVMALSQRIVVLDYGEKIADGKPEDIVRNEAVIKAYLGEEYLHHAASARA